MIEIRAAQPFAITIVDKESGWPVPLVELRTVHQVLFVSDNAGRIAFDVPELMGRETWFDMTSDGYEVPADGFGKRGVRLTPEPGQHATVKVHRTGIAKRLGRLTGAGLFAESQKLGLEKDWPESGVLGCDSVQNFVHGERMFWLWGDTNIARYPLGIFHMTGATTPVRPLEKLKPPLHVRLNYFADSNEQPRDVAMMPGEGPTWLSGLVSLPERDGTLRLGAMYLKIKAPMEAYECGLCVWNDKTEHFDHLRTVWKQTKQQPQHPPMPKGHAAIISDEQGLKWVLFGDPLPTLRCRATFEAWQDSKSWEKLTPEESIPTNEAGERIKPASGSIAWNAFRKRWVSVFMQVFGRPSAFGEIWYAEADSPYGAWGPAVKVLSHANYAFYNPRLHPEFTPADSPILIFEGTYSRSFAFHAEATPRYDYNQILYRLDLDDPKLAAARGAKHQTDEATQSKIEKQ